MSVDWAAMFTPHVSLPELFVRGTLMYLGILAVMRVFRRQKGALNAADLLVLVMVADAAQNAIAADYQSVTEGAVVVGTIFFWDYTLDTLAFFFKPMNRLINGEPLPLVEEGKINRRNMRKEMFLTEDLMEQLREQGVEDIAEVKRCCLEADGHISVIRRTIADHRSQSARALV